MDKSTIISASVAVLAGALGLALAYYLPSQVAQPVDQVADKVIEYETGKTVDIYALEQRLTGTGSK